MSNNHTHKSMSYKFYSLCCQWPFSNMHNYFAALSECTVVMSVMSDTGITDLSVLL